MNDKPPPCDGCNHPDDKLDYSPYYEFHGNKTAWRCLACWNFWLQREDGAFSNPHHWSGDPKELEPVFTWPDRTAV